MSARSAVVLGFAMWLAGESASACSIILDAPGPGETREQVGIRMERVEQRRLRAEASHVFLGRALETGYFEPVLAIKGGRPPRRVPAVTQDQCEPSTPTPGELRIVFAQCLGRIDYPWRPWRWGDGVLLGSRRPGEVRDRDLAEALRRAVAND